MCVRVRDPRSGLCVCTLPPEASLCACGCMSVGVSHERALRAQEAKPNGERESDRICAIQCMRPIVRCGVRAKRPVLCMSCVAV